MNRIEFGDCRDIMRRWIAEGVKVQTCVTSPPYFGLRDYGHPDQIGLEPTLTAYIDTMVEVFALVHELLAEDGTLWLNLGDSYAGSGRGGNPTRESSTLQGSLESQEASKIKRVSDKSTLRGNGHFGGGPKLRGSTLPAGLHEGARQGGAVGRAWVPPPAGFKQKDLMMVPARVAIALQDWGWYLRQDIIWHKPNPMPESVRDRCTKAHEYIFLLSKSERYYFDQDATMERMADSSVERLMQNVDAQAGSDRVPGKTNGRMRAVARKRGIPPRHALYSETSDQSGLDTVPRGQGRNKRSVWTVSTKPYSGAHFATFPPDLIQPCILAGASPGGIVLDPFMGSGTTAQVALDLGRQYLGCELNPDYAPLQQGRIHQQGLALA